MTLYIILRMARDEGKSSLDPIVIKFFPLMEAGTDEPLTLECPDEASAFSDAVQLFPFLRSSLAVQPLADYQRDLNKFASIAREYSRPKSPYPIRPAQAQSPRNQSPDSRRGKYPPR